MLLRNLFVTGTGEIVDVLTGGDTIRAVTAAGEGPAVPAGELVLGFERAMLFPGLINSHDHLDFNLFPPLGNSVYTNYTQWGRDIHAANRATIDAVQQVPHQLRVQWGMYKNLLNGVTTVVNHGAHLDIPGELITVFQDCYSLHSARFEKNWKRKLNGFSQRHRPFVIHMGEGTDADARNEISELIRWNIFRKKIIGIHGVAMNEQQAAAFLALVWCPVSNYFLLNKTAPVQQLKKRVPLLFGTDATLTAGWNIWEHFRVARTENSATDEELFDMVTITPAKIWKLENQGKIAPGYKADIVVADIKYGVTDWDAFYALNPEDILLVMHRGAVRLFDDTLYDSLSAQGFDTGAYSKIRINDRCKYVEGDLPALLRNIYRHYPGAYLPVSPEDSFVTA